MTTQAELARLKAQALAAQAEAKAAQAAAAQAALEAAQAELSEQVVAAEENSLSSKRQNQQLETESLSYQNTVKAGYSFESSSFTLGTYLSGNHPMPGVTVNIPIGMLNRHGLIAGATGIGKTRTLQLIAEGLSRAGVPVFLTDIKGDLSGLAELGTNTEQLDARIAEQGQPWEAQSFPTEFYSLGGHGKGIPIRTTVSDFGPLLFAKVLGLNDTQESALSLIFHWADQERLALIDLQDLRAVVSYLTSDEGKDELLDIGGIARATAGVILRKVSELQAQGAEEFFGEPAFDVADLIRHTPEGYGMISALELPDVQSRPALFSTFVMWLLAELFETLPERGDADLPKLVFFFDEAHLLFNDASAQFVDLVVQTVRLIRSKGVGIFFVTQTPKDLPDDVLGQLGAKIQHALRAHTPNDMKKLRETVKTFPVSPIDLETALPSLGTGEAIVTLLDDHGRPTPVAPTRIWAPAASMGVASDMTFAQTIEQSTTREKYQTPVDPESAYELLQARISAEQAAEINLLAQEEAKKEQEKLVRELAKQVAAEEKAAQQQRVYELRQAQKEMQRQRKRQESMLDSIVKSAGRTLAKEITRGLFGNRRR
ncbi:helicase HerA-like domain-containing protein [Arcanobacterium phocae]|uniref:helicase HerA-like domain-containing protein n=2 Tax=Arcanobacterium phocae TaxID=131112 RepID=UPI001C1292AA|nr:helicase HerA-like domain-containing protein [Arcanobacterium phocae]